MGVSAPIATAATLHRMDMLRMEAAVSASLNIWDIHGFLYGPGAARTVKKLRLMSENPEKCHFRTGKLAKVELRYRPNDRSVSKQNVDPDPVPVPVPRPHVDGRAPEIRHLTASRIRGCRF
jgi:hypothetical protein